MPRYDDCPIILREFLSYHETIKGQSKLTVNEYYLKLREFLKTEYSSYRPGTALFLRLAWSDQPMSRNSVLSGTHEAPDRAVTVLSEILEENDTFPKGLYLRNVDGVLWLRGYTCDAEYRFPADTLFAFETAGRA